MALVSLVSLRSCCALTCRAEEPRAAQEQRGEAGGIPVLPGDFPGLCGAGLDVPHPQDSPVTCPCQELRGGVPGRAVPPLPCHALGAPQ